MEPSRDKKQIEPRNHFMFGCHSTRVGSKLIDDMLQNGSGHRRTDRRNVIRKGPHDRGRHSRFTKYLILSNPLDDSDAVMTKWIRKRRHQMFHYIKYGLCQVSRWASPLWGVSAPAWIGCRIRHVLLPALLGGVFIGLSLLTERAHAAWQPAGILVGPSVGEGTIYPAQRQLITAAGYTYVMPFGLAQMNNGEIIMTASLETATTETAAVSFSTDDGNSWTPFQPIPDLSARPPGLTYLGGGNLTLFGTGYFSSDYGQTWTIQGTVDEDY